MNSRIYVVLTSLLFFLAILPSTEGWGQEQKTLFGIQLRPIIPSDIGGGGAFSVIDGDYLLEASPLTGFAFGMIVRADLSKNITLETGINRASRRYRYDFSVVDTDIRRSTEFNFINYEIPIKALSYVQLGKQTYLDVAIGTSIDIYPSDVSSFDVDVRQETYRRVWATMALEGNIGMEYRTKKSGYFYLGATYHNPFTDVATSVIRYEAVIGGVEENFNFPLNAGYLTLDLRFIFPENKD